jgi:hypothetical protein
VQEQLAAEVPHPLSEDMERLLVRWQSFAMDRPVRYEPTWERPGTVDGTPRLVIAPALLLRERDRNAWVEHYDRHCCIEPEGVGEPQPSGGSPHPKGEK